MTPMDELKAAVKQLAANVEDFRSGAVDRSTVDRLAEEVRHLQRSSGVPSGYEPDDDLGGGSSYRPASLQLAQLKGRDRFEAVVASRPRDVAQALRRPEADVR